MNTSFHPSTAHVSLLLLATTLVACASARKHDVTNTSLGVTSPTKDRSRGRHGRDPDVAEGGACDLEISCKGERDVMQQPIRLPIRGPRGQAGRDGEKGERGEDGLPGVAGLAGLSAPTPMKVAFFVGLVNNLGPVTKDSDVIFDRVVTNVGGAYGAGTGRFTAPINGTYQFHVVVSAQGRQKAAVMLVKNGVMVVTVWAESIPFWASASNTALLGLERGDEVWLVLINRASHLHGYMYSSFSGFLVFEH